MRATALIAGATLLAGLLQVVQATGSQARTPAQTATQAQAPTGSHTATLSLNSLSPRVPTKDDSVTVSGTIVNNAKVTIAGAHIGMRIGPGGPLATLSAMNSASSRSGYVSAEDGDDVPGHTVGVPDIPAGSSASFTLKVPVSALSLGSTGVYQLGVALEGQTSVESWQHVLGIKRTFLPWYADGESAKPTKINYLWPITDRPHVAARGDTASQQSPIFLDDELATKELVPGGRLQEMVDLAKNLPVTWVIDPDLLATVEAMTKGYRVAGPDGDVTNTTPGTGAALAKQWLNSLKTAVVGDQVIALPFGDTDLASLAHLGRSAPDSVAHLKTAAQLGKVTLDTILGVHSTTNVAWPVNGAIDPSIVSLARGGGASRIITRSDTFPENGALAYTPTAARPIGGGTTAVVSDASLSTAFTGDMLGAQNADLAIQNFVAQTLLITMQAPETQRTLVVAPQRRPTVTQAQAMAEAISDTDSSPWTQTVDFDTAAKAHPDPRGSHKVPPVSAYPVSLRKQELPAATFNQLQQDQDNLNEFVVILTIKDRVTVPFRNAILRAMSTGWRHDQQPPEVLDDPQGAKEFLNSIGRYLTDLINAVHILHKSTLTLSGRSGTIPVTVKNELGQPITGLVLSLTSNANIRLEIKNPQQPISIEGGHTRTLKFQTTASANGQVRISAALYTPDGSLYRSGIESFDVKITKVTDLVMLIIAAGLLLLVLAGVRIYRQRKRQAATGGDSDPEGYGDNDGNSGSSGNGAADSAEPGQPGDPAADTGQESPEPSPAGEKVDG